MVGAVADDAGEPSGWLVAVDAGRGRQVAWSVGGGAGHVVVEDEGRSILSVAVAADTEVAGAEVAVGEVGGLQCLGVLNHAAACGAVLPGGGDDDPLLPQRMPTPFPDHARVSVAAATQRINRCPKAAAPGEEPEMMSGAWPVRRSYSFAMTSTAARAPLRPRTATVPPLPPRFLSPPKTPIPIPPPPRTRTTSSVPGEPRQQAE